MDAFASRDYCYTLEAEDAKLQSSIHTENVKHYANRLLYSTHYRIFYTLITVGSLLALTILLYHRCTTPMLISLEVILNMAMIVEIGVRIAALQGHFFDSFGNLVDVGVVMLCVMTLLIVRDECSGALDLELSLEALVLIGRNGLQGVRLWRAVSR